MSKFLKTIPILRSFDEAKARDFYVGYLGFQIDWQHRFEPGLPLYMQVSLGDLQLHLSEHHGDGAPGAAVFIETTGIHDLHKELKAKGYKYARPGIEDAPWNAWTLSIRDPFHNRLMFNETKPEKGKSNSPPRP